MSNSDEGTKEDATTLAEDEILVHVGTCFGDETSPTGAILRYWLNGTSGTFRPVETKTILDTTQNNNNNNNPGWITPSCRLDDGRDVCFVLMEDDPGMVHAHFVCDEHGNLEENPVWIMPTGGVHPCHAWPILLPLSDNEQDKKSLFLVCAHYTSGNLSVIPVQITSDIDGMNVGPSCVVQHPSINYEEGNFDTHRQESPHVHCVVPHPIHPEYMAVCDLGLSTVFVYQLNGDGKLIQRHALKLRPEDGCRHCCWDKDGTHLYINNELTCTVTVASFDHNNNDNNNNECQLNHLTTINSLPKDVLPDKNHHRGNSEILIHPNGKYIYVGCRSGISSGHIAIMKIISSKDDNDDNKRNRTLQLVSHVPTYGQVPRNFKIIQSIKTKNNEKQYWLVLGNQETKTLVSYHVHPTNGTLTYSSQIDTTPYKPCNIASLHAVSIYP